MEASFEYPVVSGLLNVEASCHFANTLSDLLSEGQTGEEGEKNSPSLSAHLLLIVRMASITRSGWSNMIYDARRRCERKTGVVYLPVWVPGFPDFWLALIVSCPGYDRKTRYLLTFIACFWL